VGDHGDGDDVMVMMMIVVHRNHPTPRGMDYRRLFSAVLGLYRSSSVFSAFLGDPPADPPPFPAIAFAGVQSCTGNPPRNEEGQSVRFEVRREEGQMMMVMVMVMMMTMNLAEGRSGGHREGLLNGIDRHRLGVGSQSRHERWRGPFQPEDREAHGQCLFLHGAGPPDPGIVPDVRTRVIMANMIMMMMMMMMMMMLLMMMMMMTMMMMRRRRTRTRTRTRRMRRMRRRMMRRMMMRMMMMMRRRMMMMMMMMVVMMVMMMMMVMMVMDDRHNDDDDNADDDDDDDDDDDTVAQVRRILTGLNPQPVLWRFRVFRYQPSVILFDITTDLSVRPTVRTECDGLNNRLVGEPAIPPSLYEGVVQTFSDSNGPVCMCSP
jgi:hypothetical protein